MSPVKLKNLLDHLFRKKDNFTYSMLSLSIDDNNLLDEKAISARYRFL